MKYQSASTHCSKVINKVKVFKKQDVFVKHNAPDNGQFQQRQRSQRKKNYTSRKILSQQMTMFNMEALVSYFLRSNDQCQFFFIRKMSRSNLKIKYLQKDLISRDIHVKYQSSGTHYSKVISKI